jgi:hypothetical protein
VIPRALEVCLRSRLVIAVSLTTVLWLATTIARAERVSVAKDVDIARNSRAGSLASR